MWTSTNLKRTMAEEERRRKVQPYISHGSIIAAISFVASAAGVYISVVTDLSAQKKEIQHIKENTIKAEAADKEIRNDIKQEIRDIKNEMRETRQEVQRILIEIQRLPKPPARRPQD
jgi:protein subunit release factor A